MLAAAASIAAAPRKSWSNSVLGGAGMFWFAIAMIGQWAFFYYIVAFYGASAVSGHFEIWNRLQAVGRTPYVAGDTGGNLAFAAHAIAAGIIAFGGALQLIPQVRRYAPDFHRWNGRLFLLTVTGLSLSGFYLSWIRHTSPTTLDALSTTFNGCLILTFAALTLKTAMARDLESHRRWAMRLYLVSNAQWFLRVGLFGYFVIGAVLGREPDFGDPFVRIWTFGCYLVPLAMLELYLRTRRGANAPAKIAVAASLVALTLVMAAGIFAFGMFSQRIITGAPLAFS